MFKKTKVNIHITNPNKKQVITFGKIGVYSLLIILSIYFLLPLYIMLVTSLKTMPEIRTGSILSLPKTLYLHPWKEAWSTACIGSKCTGISDGFLNSIYILIPSTFLSVIISALNGYALSLWKVRWGHLLLSCLILGAFIPYQIILYPLVKVIAFLGLYGSLGGIILVHIFFGLPMQTLIFRNFYLSVPKDLMKSAYIDSGNFFVIFFHIILPLSTTILIVSVILQITGIWNDYLLGLTFAGGDYAPMTVKLNNLVNTTFGVKKYNVNMAATLLTALLPLLVYFISGKFFVRGITNGSVKGD